MGAELLPAIAAMNSPVTVREDQTEIDAADTEPFYQLLPDDTVSMIIDLLNCICTTMHRYIRPALIIRLRLFRPSLLDHALPALITSLHTRQHDQAFINDLLHHITGSADRHAL